MTKVSLIEPADHGEVVYQLCELLMSSGLFEVTVLCKRYIADQAPEYLKDNSSTKWCPFPEHQSLREAISHKLDILPSKHLIFWTTLPTDCGWINRLKLNAPMIAIIHNRYTWFAPFKHLSLRAIATPLGMLRLLRLLLWQRRQQKQLIGHLAAVAFLSQTVLDCALAEKHPPPSGLAFAIPPPFPVLQREQLVLDAQIVRAVIPGSITSNGRDYAVVSEAIAQALPLLDKKLHLICLGKRNKAKGLKQLEQMTGPKFELTTFTNWIPNAIYEQQLLEADFLILPTKKYRIFGLIKERISQSAISGGVNDAIKYNLPLLIAAEYKFADLGIPRDTRIYANATELTKLIVEAVNHPVIFEGRTSQRLNQKSTNTLEKEMLNVLKSCCQKED